MHKIKEIKRTFFLAQIAYFISYTLASLLYLNNLKVTIGKIWCVDEMYQRPAEKYILYSKSLLIFQVKMKSK